MDFLTAASTLALALMTAWLAWSTRTLAASASAQLGTTRLQVERSHRPIVVPANETNVGGEQGSGRTRARVVLVNVGMGPALRIRGNIATRGPASGEGQGTSERQLQALAVGEQAELTFVPLEGRIFPEEEVRVRLAYEDVGDQTYSTEAHFDVSTRIWSLTTGRADS